MNFKRFVVGLLAVAIAVALSVSLASANYVVIKDKNGVCKVIQAQEKTPKTIAGPFKTKEEAQKAKAEECAKAAIPGVETAKEKAKEKAEEKARKAKEKAKESNPPEKK